MDWTDAMNRLRAERGFAAVARATGIAEWHLRRLASGETKHPRIDTAAKVLAYYKHKRRRPKDGSA